jgi:2-methylcitrate dehydratase PrpD
MFRHYTTPALDDLSSITQAPETAYEAKFSGPYTVASALIGGSGLGLGIDDFTDELVRDPTRQALMRRISVTSDPRCDSSKERLGRHRFLGRR